MNDTPGKNKFRIGMVNAVVPYSHINALTLCGNHRHFEKLLHKKHKNAYITSCELNKAVFENAASSIDKRKLTFDMGNHVKKGRNEIWNQSIEEYLSNTTKRFNLIWIDFCGIVTPNVFNLSLENKFEDGSGIFAISLVANRYRKDISERLNGRDIRTYVKDEIYKKLPSEFEYDQEMSGVYRDSAAMMNVVFRK